MYKIAVALLNYKSGPETSKAITHLFNAKLCPDKVFVVDNDSRDDSFSHVSPHLNKHVVWIDSGANAGYSCGNNIAIKHAAVENFSYILILNPDCVPDKNCLFELSRVLDLNSGVAIACPTFLSHNDQNLRICGGQYRGEGITEKKRH